MFKIQDGRTCLYQWDLDRKLVIEDINCSEVHFSNRTTVNSLSCKTYIENEQLVVDIPNILLQEDWEITAYAYDEFYTKYEQVYKVKKRPKPTDYVYTETEILKWETLEKKADDAIAKSQEALEGVIKANEAAEQAIAAIPDMASKIVNSASGEVIKITDSAEAPMEVLNVYGKTTQANAAPTPDNPQELESVGETVDVSVYGKNIFNNDTSLLKEVSYRGASGAGTRIGYELLTLPAGTYTFSLINSGTVSDIYIYGVVNDKDGNHVRNCHLLANTVNNTPLTITVNDGDKIYIYDGNSYLSVSASAKRFNSLQIQLEAGSTATPYEPYKEPQTFTVNTPNGLKGIPVTSDGNYTDSNGQQWITDEIDYNRGVYIQRIGKFECTDANTLNMYTCTKQKEDSTAYYFNHLIPNATYYKPMMSNMYGGISSGATSYEGYYKVSKANNNYSIFTGEIADLGAELTRDNVRAWLRARISTDNPLIVYYALETPVETPLTQELIEAYTKYPNTTILTDKAGLKVSYVADTKNYIDNKFAELQAAVISLGGNV